MRVARRRGRAQRVAAIAMLLLAMPTRAQSPLASGELRILGVELTVGPASQTAPKNQATGLTTALVDPANPTQSVADPSFANVVVKGELSGPGICSQAATPAPPCLATGVMEVSATPGQILPIPPLLAVGNYVVDNLRLEDGQGNFIVPAEPAVATIDVVDKIIVTSVSSRPLSLQALQDQGIVIDNSSFSAFEFTFGIGTESNQVPMSFDIAFPKDPSAPDSGGGLSLPPIIPTLDIPNLDVHGLMLEGPPLDGEKVQLPPIPALIVIPGNIAFLHQFFQVIVLVSNLAPPGTQLVVTSATATTALPLGADGTAGSPDDPLSFARAQAETPASPGTTDIRNKADGSADFGPSQDGQGQFFLEGKLEGTYPLDVAIHAQLLGLPIGPVPLSGKATGTVLVRNPNFALTFNHPDVVRAGETYQLFVTIHNTGNADANCVTMTLDPKDISGATLTNAGWPGGQPAPPNPCPAPSGVGTVVVPTIKRNDAQTVEFDLIARKNGQVTATGFTADPSPGSGQPLTAGFVLRTGIGDRGVPLSPESLVLAPYVNDLPPDFFQTAMRVLGLAHSVATAPAGAPIGITNHIAKTVVDHRAQQLTEAGLRIRIGDQSVTSIGDVMLDWLGNGYPGTSPNTSTNFDPGFDEVMRTTDAGHDLEAAWAAQIQGLGVGGQGLGDLSIIGYQQTFAAAEQYRPTFASVAVSGGATIAITDDHGRSASGVGAQAIAPVRNIPGTVLLDLNTGELAVIGRTDQSAFYDIVITGSPDPGPLPAREGTQIGLVVPDGSGGLRQFVFSNVALNPGEAATVRIAATSSAPVLVLPNPQPLTPSTLSFDPHAGPRVVGVRQIPEADPLERGRVVAVLYDRDIDPDHLDGASGSAGARFILNYADGQAPLAQGRTQDPMKRLKLLPSNRLALVNFLSSVSRFFHYTLTSTGAQSPGGTPQVPASDTRAVVADFITPDGGILSGYVRKGTGDPIVFAPVELREQFLDDITGLPMETVTGQTNTDASGYYRFDFVGEDDIGPFRVTAQDPDNGERAQRLASIVQEHQEMRIDLLMLGLGRVTGTVLDADHQQPVPNASITVKSLTDESEVHGITDANGQFTANNVAVGNLLVSATLTDANTGAVSSGSVAATLTTAGATANVTVLLFAGAGAVEGVVYNQTSNGLQPVGAGIPVAVFDDGDLFEQFERDVRTDSGGHFRIDGVKPGMLHVRAVRQATAEEVTVSASVAPGTTTAVNVIFAGTATVVGQVVYPNGQPVPNSSVVGGTTLVRTDAHGNFVIAQVGLGHQAFEAVDPDGVNEAVAYADINTPGTTVPVVITLPGSASITGSVRNASGQIQVGAPVFLWVNESGYLRASTDTSGAYRFTKLPLGNRYVLRASTPQGDGVQQAVQLTVPGEILHQDLQFVGLVTVTGVVLGPPDLNGVSSPLTAQVIVKYESFNPYGQLEDKTTTVSADQLVGATGCSQAQCAGGGTDCGGRFTLQIPTGLTYRAEALSPFNGDPAAVSGQLQTPGAVAEYCLVLGQSGSVRGVVFLANGARAGAGIEVTYQEAGTTPQPERTALTDVNGEFRFTLLAPRPFVISARDPATGNRGVVRGSALTGDEAVADVNLLGQGAVAVRVVDGSGHPVPNAIVQLTSGSPVAFLLPPFPQLITADSGPAIGSVEYSGLPEGEFSVTAQDPTSLSGGRSGDIIVEDLSQKDVTVVVGTFGTVTGTLWDATATNTLPFAQVHLIAKGHPGAYTASDAAGVYTFDFVPLGSFSLEFLDPRTGRIGLGAGALDFATEVVPIDLFLLPVGTVSGTITRPSGAVVGGTRIELSSGRLVRPLGLISDSALFGPGKLTTTSNLSGAYAITGVPQGDFSVSASDPATGASGNGSGHLSSEGETVPLSITLAGRGSVSGHVFLADGITPVAFANLALTSGGTHLNLQTDNAGSYAFASVPLGPFSVSAKEQGGNDGGSTNGQLAVDGQAVSADIVFVGTGTIRGRVVDALGQSGTAGTALTLVRRFAGGDVRAATDQVLQATFNDFGDASGHFSFTDIPLGTFTLTASLVGSGLAGNASGVLSSAGEIVDNLEIVIEPAGAVDGSVRLSDAVHPAVNTVISLTGTSDQTGQSFTAFTLSASDGGYMFTNVPVGSFSISAFDSVTRGVGNAFGRLDSAGMTLPLAPITLDDTVPAVVSVSPAAGATGVALSAPIVIGFSDQVSAASVTASSVIVRTGSAVVAGALAVDAGRTQVTFTPAANWPELSSISVEVNQNVRDDFGRPVPTVLRSFFLTADVTPPRVVSANLVQGQVVIQWSEAVATGSGSVALAEVLTGAPVSGSLSYSNGYRMVIFKPDPPLPDDRSFRVVVSGWRDLVGNAQATTFSATFSTTDHVGPTITLSSSVAADTAILGESVVITAMPASDSEDMAVVDFYVGDQRVNSDNSPPFTHTFAAAAAVTIQAIATDFAGNRGTPASIAIAVADNQPPAVQLTAPAAGTTIGTGQTLTVTAAATDDLELREVELDVRGRELTSTWVVHFAPGQTSKTAAFSVPIPAAAQPDDQLGLSVIARDSRGVASAPSSVSVRVVDATAPTATITSLVGNFTVDPGVAIPVTVQADDAVGVTRIRLTTIGGVGSQSEFLVAPPLVTTNHTFGLLISSTVAQGSMITLIAEAVDAVGNVGTAPRIALTARDATPPTVTIVSPADGVERIAGAAIAVGAQASDNAAMKQVDFFVDGRLVASDRSADIGGMYNATILTQQGATSTVIGAQAVDAQGNVSTPATVTVPLHANRPPTADAGSDHTVLTGAVASVSGAGSSDPDNQPLTYRWRWISKPVGSAASVFGSVSRNASVIPDVAGTYTLGLIVNDGIDDSSEDTVDLSAVVATPTNTFTTTPTPTDTGTPTQTFTPSHTPTITPTASGTATPSNTGPPTATPTNTNTPTNTATPTITPVPSPTPTPTSTGAVTAGTGSITLGGVPDTSAASFLTKGLSTATEAAGQWDVSSARFRDLEVICSVAPGSGKSWGVTVRINGNPTTLSATISDSAVSAEDTTHTIDVNDNDLLSIQAVPSGTPASAYCVATMGVYANGSNTVPHNAMILIGSGQSVFLNASSTFMRYCGPSAGGSSANLCTASDAPSAAIPVPNSATIAAVRVNMSTPLAGSRESYTVQNATTGNVSDTTCTVEKGSKSCATATCSSNCGLNGGDLFAVRMVKDIGQDSVSRNVTVELSGIVQPIGTSFTWNNSGSGRTTDGIYFIVSGPQPGPLQRVVRSGRVQNLRVTATANPGVDTVFVLQTGSGGTTAVGNTALTCTVPNLGVASCNDLRDTVAVNKGDTVRLSLGNGAASTGIVRWSMELVDVPAR